MAQYVSPGASGVPSTVIQGRGGMTASKLRSRGLAFSTSALKSGDAQFFRKVGITSTVKITGLDVLVEDMFATSQFWGEVVFPLMDITGIVVTHNARQFVPIDTGDTYRSIHHNIFTAPGGLGVEIGPTTYYSPILEHGSIKFPPRPFMLPAATMAEEDFKNVIQEIAAVAGNNRRITTTSYTGLDSVLSKYRGRLYSTSRAMGNISAITGSAFMPAQRARMMTTAKQIGNIQAVMRNDIGGRFVRVVRGRAIGSVQGGVTGSVSTSESFTADLGPIGARVYNVTVGRIGRDFLR